MIKYKLFLGISCLILLSSCIKYYYPLNDNFPEATHSEISIHDKNVYLLDYTIKSYARENIDTVFNYNLKNGVQRDVLLYLITNLARHENNYRHAYFDLLNLMQPIGYSLPIKITPINLKYSIPSKDNYKGVKNEIESYRFYDVYIDTPVDTLMNKLSLPYSAERYYYWKRDMNNVILEPQKFIRLGAINIEERKYYKSKYKTDIHIKNHFLIAARYNLGSYSLKTQILYLDKNFYSFEYSKEQLYKLFINTATPEHIKHNKRGLGIKINHSDNSGEIIYLNPSHRYYPFKGNPQELIPFIYIMSWSEYEPEDVFYKKRMGYQFYYTFYSNKYKKNYRVHYNARTGEFVKYTETKNAPKP